MIFATWPVAFTLYSARSTLPSSSTTTVERMTPTTVLPYSFFSPKAPYASRTCLSGSPTSVTFRFSCSRNFASFSGLSGRRR